MKNATTSNAIREVPPSSAGLLALALFFAVAAWSAVDINRELPPAPTSQGLATAETVSSGQSGDRAGYQARRHSAVSLGKRPPIPQRPHAGGGEPLMQASL